MVETNPSSVYLDAAELIECIEACFAESIKGSATTELGSSFDK